MQACPRARSFFINQTSFSVLYSPTSVVVVPAAGVVVLQHLRRAPGLQQVVHLVLLPPGQRLAQDLPRFVHVEVPGAQEPQYVLVLRDLKESWDRTISVGRRSEEEMTATCTGQVILTFKKERETKM